jgi:primosomal protein N' (replication factor Y)
VAGVVTVAKVAVENAVYHFDKAFTYRVPEVLLPSAKTGCRVIVPFGTANGKRQGIILGLEGLPGPEPAKLKSIFSVADRAPLLSQEAVGLVFWIKEHTFCTLFEAAKLFFPAGVKLKIRTEYSLAKPLPDFDAGALDEEEKQAVSYLSHKKNFVPREKLLKDLGLSADSPVPENLLRAGILVKNSGTVRQVTDATQKMVRLSENPSAPKLTPKQQNVLQVLRDAGSASLKELCYFAGVTPAVVGALVKKGLAQYYDVEVYRNPYGSAPLPEASGDFRLSGEQQAAFSRMYAQYRSGKGGVSLLFGVTGSGKTSVFMRLIDHVRDDGRGVIVMVPEISLTPQTIALFRARYGTGVAVFHSGLTLAERLDEWKRVRNGDASIVVGTRSAVFAPFQKIGLIIMDEEQESTYKSESSPRYHARDIAKYRCAYHQALLVLSSATPSVESYYYAQSGRYSLSTLTSRYGKARLPQVDIIDMNRELERGNRSIFSLALEEALRSNLGKKKQSILLLNRRGYNTFVSCRACGHVLTCPNCSITLTYHAANQRLMCHYCGFSIPFTKECPYCHEEQVHYSGFGTQRAQQQLSELLPQARILRLDADSTMTRFAYDKKLKQFLDGEYDIIIGTQMVAKGLDFENVTLVGVLSADQTLYGDDFRSYERAFDLLTQVVGRSGRGRYSGRAVIQTFTPENKIIKLAARQDYPEFYRGEIALRKAMLYPPFSDLCMVGFVGTDETKVRSASVDFLQQLKETAQREYPDQPMRVLNPSPALVGRVSNKYRYKLLIKCRNSKKMRELISRLLVWFPSRKEHAGVTAFSDMNPDSIL